MVDWHAKKTNVEEFCKQIKCQQFDLWTVFHMHAQHCCVKLRLATLFYREAYGLIHVGITTRTMSSMICSKIFLGWNMLVWKVIYWKLVTIISKLTAPGSAVCTVAKEDRENIAKNNVLINHRHFIHLHNGFGHVCMAEARGDNCHVPWRSAIVVVVTVRSHMLSCRLRKWYWWIYQHQVGIKKMVQ